MESNTMTSYKRLTLGSKTEKFKAKGLKKKKKVQANSNQRRAEVMILL